MRPFLITASFLLIVLAACAPAAPAPQERQPEPARYEPAPPPPFPEWFLNIPSEPGRAFYGVGVASYKTHTGVQLAKDAAELSARQQIAATIESTVQGMVQRYAEQVLTAEGDVVEESLSRSVARTIVDNVMRGVEIVKFESGPRDEHNGTYPLFALARISFDSVAENLHDEVGRRVEAVRERADEAFAELDRMLEQEQERRADEEAERDPEAEVEKARVVG